MSRKKLPDNETFLKMSPTERLKLMGVTAKEARDAVKLHHALSTLKEKRSAASVQFLCKLYFEILREDGPMDCEDAAEALQRSHNQDILQELGICKEDVLAYLTAPEQSCPRSTLPTRGLSDASKELIRLAKITLTANRPQTLRQIFYRIFSLAVLGFENNNASYRRLGRLLKNARRDYRAWELEGRIGSSPEFGIPTTWVIDEGRRGELVSMWDNPAEYFETVRTGYRRNNWQDQPEYVELWSEKAATLESMRSIADEWGIMLRTCRGFGSASMEHQVGRLFESIKKPITVLYIGDCDPSGVKIDVDMRERTERAAGVSFTMERLAVLYEDIKKFKLPPQKIKPSNHDTEGYRKNYGKNTVELDALPVEELKRRVVEAISNHIDVARWNQANSTEDAQFQSMSEYIDLVKNLPQLNPEAGQP